jgi:hypothetical protein
VESGIAVTSEVLALVESSLIGRTATAVVAQISRAYRASRTGRAITSAAASWRAMPSADRRWTIGLALMTAAGVHVGLQLINGAPPSWLWLIVPAVAVAHGLLQILAAGGARMPK